MKYKLALLIALFFSVSFAQSITLEEVLALKNKNKVETKDYLTTKNWEMMHDHYSEEFKFGDIRFSFDNKNPDRQLPVCIGFYYEGDDLTKNRIIFETSSKDKFDDFVVQFTALDFKLINSKSDVNQTTETFKNETATIEATIMPVENHDGSQKVFYKFYITDNNYIPTEYRF